MRLGRRPTGDKAPEPADWTPFTKRFDQDACEQALESWQWLEFGGKTTLMTSLFGDVFLRGSDGIWWLDTVVGALTKEWSTAEELEVSLRTEDGQDEYLRAGLVLGARRQGKAPSATEIYDFTINPVFGGEIAVANLGVIDFVVGVNIRGQIHDQVRGLAPGTKIGSVTIDGQPPPGSATP